MNILEDKSSEKILNYEIAIIVNSLNSFDYLSYQEPLNRLLLLNTEINIFSYDVSPIVTYCTLAKLTDGIYYYGGNNDLTTFMNYIQNKKIRFTRQFINKVKVKLLLTEGCLKKNSAVCVCHSKLW